MNELQILSFNETTVRTIMIDGEPWWVLADVCRVLGLGSPHKVAARLRDDEKGRTLIPTLGGPQQMTIVNEPGLYKVILRSDSPKAEPLMDWVTHEVIPSIRKTGSYSIPKPVPELPAPRVAQAKRILAQCSEIQHETVQDRPETKINVMKTVKKLLQENGFNAPSIIVDPASATMQDVNNMINFIFDHPGTTWEEHVAALLIPQLDS